MPQDVPIYAATIDARLPKAARVTVYDFAPIRPLRGGDEVRANGWTGAVTDGSGDRPLNVVRVEWPAVILWRFPYLVVEGEPTPLTPHQVLGKALAGEPGYSFVPCNRWGDTPGGGESDAADDRPATLPPARAAVTFPEAGEAV